MLRDGREDGKETLGRGISGVSGRDGGFRTSTYAASNILPYSIRDVFVIAVLKAS